MSFPVFLRGRLHKHVRRSVRRHRMSSLLWVLVPDGRQLLHKGRKP